MKKLNVYAFTVYRKSMAPTSVAGQAVCVCADSKESASADLLADVGDDLVKIAGPTLAIEGAYYNDGTPEPLPEGPDEIKGKPRLMPAPAGKSKK